jgi:hypothetical protein
MGKESKLVGGVPSGLLKAPPNNCIPNSAKIRMNKNRRNNKDMMDRIELNSEITRFLKDDQYFVTLNILRRRRARKTERPNDECGLK